MTDARALALRAIGEKAILDAAKELNDQTRAALSAAMGPGDRLTIKHENGTTMGVCLVSDPKGTLKITDQQAFTRWVAANHPDAIIPTVNPAWQRALLAKGADENGEVPDGCEIITGAPVLSVRPSERAKALALGLVRREVER